MTRRAFGAENLGELSIDGRGGQIDLEEPSLRRRLRSGRASHQDRWLPDIEYDDLDDAAIFLETLDELGAEERAGAGDGHRSPVGIGAARDQATAVAGLFACALAGLRGHGERQPTT